MAKPNRVTELPPTAEIQSDAARPDLNAGHADTEGALDRLERFLASWSPKNPPPKIRAPMPTAGAAERPVSRADGEAPAPGSSRPTTKLRPRRRVLKGALLVLAVASAAGAAFALNGAPAALNKLTSLSFDRAPDFLRQLPPISFDRAPDLLKQLPSIVLNRAQSLLKQPPAGGPASRPTATPPAGDGSVAGSGAAGMPPLKEESDPARVKGAHSEETRANSAAPAAASPAVGSRAAAPQAASPVPDRPAEPPSENALIATPVSPAATGVPPPAEPVKPAVEPEPKRADASSGGMAPSGSTPPALQSDKPSLAGEGAKPHATALVPLPPARPPKHGRRFRRERTPRAHEVAEEPQAAAMPPAPPPERTESPTERGPANPLLRAMSNAFK
jgi:hypothetical protein